MIPLQQSFLAYMPSLTCAQIKIYHLLNFLCGEACQWIAISTRNITGPLELQRENALLAIRGLLAAGLIQKHDQGTKRKSWYRTTPSMPLPEKNWMSKLTEVRIPVRSAESGPDSGPDQNWNENRTSLPKSGTKTGPDSKPQTGRQTGPPILQIDDVSTAHPYMTLTSQYQQSSSSIKSVPTTDDFLVTLQEKFIGAGKAAPTAQQSSAIVARLNGKQSLFLEFLTPDKMKRIRHPGALPSLASEFLAVQEKAAIRAALHKTPPREFTEAEIEQMMSDEDPRLREIAADLMAERAKP